MRRLTPKRKRAIFLALLIFGASLVGGVAFVAAETFLNSFYSCQGPIHHQADNGLEVIQQNSYDCQSGNPYTPSSFNLSTEKSGWMNISSTTSGQVTIDNIEGTWSNTSGIDAIGSQITMNPSDKSQVTVTGDITSVEWRSGMAVDDGTTDFTYASSLGSGSVTLNGLTTNTDIAAIDASNNDVLDVATSDGAGQVTFSGLDSGSHDVELATSSGGPTAVDGSASPDGNIASDTPTLSIDVEDPDFPAGDEVTVDWYVDSSQVHSETITSNQTVTHTTSQLLGGDHTWHVELEDAYGQTDTSDTFDANVPANITIREESEPHDIVNNAQVEVLIAGSGETVDQQTISDGNVSLVGLPLDETYVILVDSPNHHLRGVIVEDMFDQASVFVLNETHTSVENVFFVEDNTGRFTDPNIIVQKPINRSLYDSSTATEYSWTTIGGDRLGADSRLVIDLKHSDRYRIIIENTEGDRRILGEYTAALNGTVTLTVGEITWQNPTTGEGYQIEAYETNASGQDDGINDQIVIQYENPNNGTSEFCVVVHESGNVSNTLQPEDCASDIGTYKAVIPVSGDDLNTSWVANWSATVNGTEYGSTIPLSGIRELPIPIDPTWLGPGVLILLIGGLAATPKASARTGGLLIVAFAFGLTWWGWVAIPLPALGLAGAVALLGKAADFNTRY